MRLLIIHLTDLHMREGGNGLSTRVEQLEAAIRSACVNVDAGIMVVTGDVAFSGKQAEYAEAADVVSRVRRTLVALGVASEVAIVPGNHDCNFENDSQARRALIATASTAVSEMNGSDTSLIDSCVAVQRDFFTFLDSFAGLRLEGFQKLFYLIDKEVAGRSIRIRCYNTAWMSQVKEKQGSLVFPVSVAVDDGTVKDCVISLFHHPYNWLEAENSREFRRHVEQTSDLILTGHEHVAEMYEKTTLAGEVSHYIEGHVLQETGSSRSGFNVVNVDLEGRRWMSTTYEWVTGDRIYKPKEVGDWKDFHRGAHVASRRFENTKDYAAYLSDCGAGFTHPRATNLTLDDLFVYPNVGELAADRTPDSFVHGDKLLEYLKANERVLFVGSERAGKTALARKLYRFFQGGSLVPVLVPGSSLRSADANEVSKLIARSVEDQYGQAVLNNYEQLEPTRRVLMIDDFHKAALNRHGRDVVLRALSGRFGKIVLFVDDIFQLKELTSKRDEQHELLRFKWCFIRHFGHERRSQMIEKWYSLGQEYTGDTDAIAEKVAKTEKMINTLLGKNLLPAYPIFILALLQSLEARTSLSTATGSYGYIYELLITAALSRGGKGTTLDTKYTFIGALAYHVFSTGESLITDHDVFRVGDQYFSDYKLRVLPHEITEELVDSSILLRIDGGYRFKYRYLYYYFVARYFQENLTSARASEVRSKLADLSEHVYREESANIIIFYMYLTKDPVMIAAILGKARTIFQEQAPCDLDQDVRFMMNSKALPPRLAYYETEPREARREYLEGLDEAETLAQEDADESRSAREDRELEELLKINLAFKTIQIMGQILRNFPGSLRGELKLEIARETYLLGFRALKVVLAVFHDAADDFKQYINDFLRTERKVTDEILRREKADQFWSWLMIGIGCSFVKTISSAVGSEQLRETYKELMAENETVAFSLVDISIKLDHFRPTPSDEIIELNRELGNNVFASTILRQLVLDFLYLYPTDYKTRQRICQRLEIAIKPKALDRSDKKG